MGVPLCPNLGLLQVINSRSDIFNATSTTPKVCFVDLAEKLVLLRLGLVLSTCREASARKRKDLEGRKDVR